jgi:hypothetical protein
MSGDGSNPNAIQDGAKELLKKPLISSQTYWILYIVNRRPVEDSTYHVKKHSTEIPVLTKPDDEKNLMNALKQFRTREAVKITVLRTYLDYEKAEKDAKNYNNQYAESKKINQRIQSNKRRLV